MDEYYKTLGLPVGASQEEIKRAYRRLALLYHPDRNPNNPVAEEFFKRINEAYRILTGQERPFIFSTPPEPETPQQPPEPEKKYYRGNPKAAKEEKSFVEEWKVSIACVVLMVYLLCLATSAVTLYSRLNYHRALNYYKDGLYEKAYTAANKSVNGDPSYARAYFLKAKICTEHYKDNFTAIFMMSNAIEHSDLPDWKHYYFRSLLFLKDKQIKFAYEDYLELKKLNVPQINLWTKEAHKITENWKDEYEQKGFYDSLVRWDTSNMEALSYRAKLYVNWQLFETAESDLNKLLAINPEADSILLYMAKVYYDTYRDKQACEMIVKSARLGNKEAKELVSVICEN